MLTKSDLQSFLQCPRKLWLEHNRQDLLPNEHSGLNRRAFDGLIVGEKARRQLGENYVWPRSGDSPITRAENAKNELLASPQSPAAEVPLLAEDLYARADALLPRNEQWVLRETKASTFPLKKDRRTPDAPAEHLVEDVAIQRWVRDHEFQTSFTFDQRQASEIFPVKVYGIERDEEEFTAAKHQIRELWTSMSIEGNDFTIQDSVNSVEGARNLSSKIPE